MEKTYDPHSIEKTWYNIWEKAGYFRPSGAGEPFCIMLPPPNVTGNLHMGHGFQISIMDALVRYHRMKGHNTLWQGGTDHAGIATQMVVERQLLKKGQSRHEMGREKFIEQIWQWKKKSGSTITQQLRRMGASLDWDRECFTMDESMSHAVQEVFIQLHDEGLIYRDKHLVNWDPKLLTAISDLEVANTEENGHLWHLRYPLTDGSGHLTVVTTRPETMLGDTGVAVNPNDERYKHLIGKEINLPLCDRTIPIIADDAVEKEFASGCVKITPAHDFTDYEIGQRANLEKINIFTPDAHINENAPAAYQGLDRFDARDKIIKDLDALGLLEKVEDHKLTLPRGDRSGVIIEPYLTDQWFVNAKALAEPAIRVVEKGEIKFVPENWIKTYYQWMHNIEDWCISRQLWWGHRIPAWYDEEGKIYVGRNEDDVRIKHRLGPEISLTQDEDVLDTWFSSALYPFSTLGWPKHTKELENFYPTSVLVTGFDIIFFWVARMIMMGLKFTGKIPFHKVYITGLIRDSEGQKMSKTKGNALDPIDLIDGIDLDTLVKKRTSGLMQPEMATRIDKATRKEFPEGIQAYGTDAVRFTFCALASTGRDIRFDLHRLGGYRNFCNKIWNAARYVFMQIDKHEITEPTDPKHMSLADHWITSCLQTTISEVTQHIEQYRFDLATKTIYDFVWGEFCDWYLELSKPVLYQDSYSDEEKSATQYTLLNTLETILRMTHPFMPYITEEIWQKAAKPLGLIGNSILFLEYPEANKKLINPEIMEEVQWMKQFIMGLRNIRGEFNISPNKEINILVTNASENDLDYLSKNQKFLQSLAKIQEVTVLTENDKAPESAIALVGEMQILVPLKGLIDVEAEIQRLKKSITKQESELERSEKKLQNQSYIDRAPANVVEKERDRVAELNIMIQQLSAQLQQLSGKK